MNTSLKLMMLMFLALTLLASASPISVTFKAGDTASEMYCSHPQCRALVPEEFLAQFAELNNIPNKDASFRRLQVGKTYLLPTATEIEEIPKLQLRLKSELPALTSYEERYAKVLSDFQNNEDEERVAELETQITNLKTDLAKKEKLSATKGILGMSKIERQTKELQRQDQIPRSHPYPSSTTVAFLATIIISLIIYLWHLNYKKKGLLIENRELKQSLDWFQKNNDDLANKITAQGQTILTLQKQSEVIGELAVPFRPDWITGCPPIYITVVERDHLGLPLRLKMRVTGVNIPYNSLIIISELRKLTPIERSRIIEWNQTIWRLFDNKFKNKEKPENVSNAEKIHNFRKNPGAPDAAAN